MTMTPPRYLTIGDEIHSHITGIGDLHNRCIHSPRSTGGG
jgi:hypothetical protein